ncbi:hypothetical protein KKF86_03165 [bacterium]|nr:hypothetical protein [bacterium]
MKKDIAIMKKIIAINLILFAVLYLSVSFNKEFIRPVYGNTPILGILTGSFSNFMAAYIISLFPIAAILKKKLNVKISRSIIYTVAIMVFIILTVAEIQPRFDISKVYDIYDIIASGIGSLLAIITFKLLIRKTKLIKQT